MIFLFGTEAIHSSDFNDCDEQYFYVCDGGIIIFEYKVFDLSF